MKPVKPKDIIKLKKVVIPESIIECVNEMIAEQWDGSKAIIRQGDLLEKVLDTVLDRYKEKFRKEIFEKHWFDFEPLFRKAGWQVSFDKPGYNEDYGAYFVFSKKKAK